MIIDYILFGIVDNAVMIIGALTGKEIENFLPKRFQKGTGAVIGAGLGNAVSDFMGGISSGNLDLAVFTAVGCLIGLVVIPIVLVGKARFKGRKEVKWLTEIN